MIAERVRELTAAGRSATQIAALLNITDRTVTRYRRHTGISKPRNNPFTPEQLALAEQLLDDGCSYGETARTVGASRQGIRQRFPSRGWTQVEGGAYGALVSRMARSGND